MLKMKFIKSYLFLIVILLQSNGYSQFNLSGDFRLRWYSDQFKGTMDNRGPEDYLRTLGRLRSQIKIDKYSNFNAELTTINQSLTIPARNIGGTGKMSYGISQLFAEIVRPNFLYLDLVRLRAGRQQFVLGNGLVFGDSYYYLDKFDGGRLDLSYNILNLTLFGAITGQNVSSSGLYPDPGSDQIYVAKLGADVYNQDLMSYFVLQKLRGLYNDSYTVGIGDASTLLNNNLEYFGEFAYQKFNTAPGLPKMQGIGYMAGLSYKWAMGPFRTIKIESSYAAYQGDNKNTNTIERFAPPFPSFFWGEATGYVNGTIGGEQPHNGMYADGCRIWFSRIYFVPKMLPGLRVQFSYCKVTDYINTDNYNEHDDELAVRVYYNVSQNTRLQFRFGRVIPNGGAFDINGSGTISSTEDRFSETRFMTELNFQF
jgi:hypothetical protein